MDCHGKAKSAQRSIHVHRLELQRGYMCVQSEAPI